MTDLRTAAQQALEALDGVAQWVEQRPATHPWDAWQKVEPAITALRAALAQQAEPTGKKSLQVESVVAENATTQQQIEQTPPSDYQRGYWAGFAIGKREGRIEAENELAQQAEPGEPVAWIYQNMYTEQEYLVWKKGTGGRNWRPLYTAPPQRKPLPKQDQHCVDVPGYGLVSVRLVRAVERAHNITDPQIADRLARHGIPMPEGDPK